MKEVNYLYNKGNQKLTYFYFDIEKANFRTVFIL